MQKLEAGFVGEKKKIVEQGMSMNPIGNLSYLFSLEKIHTARFIEQSIILELLASVKGRR